MLFVSKRSALQEGLFYIFQLRSQLENQRSNQGAQAPNSWECCLRLRERFVPSGGSVRRLAGDGQVASPRPRVGLHLTSPRALAWWEGGGCVRSEIPTGCEARGEARGGASAHHRPQTPGWLSVCLLCRRRAGPGRGSDCGLPGIHDAFHKPPMPVFPFKNLHCHFKRSITKTVNIPHSSCSSFTRENPKSLVDETRQGS